jgi:hypothetical protein
MKILKHLREFFSWEVTECTTCHFRLYISQGRQLCEEQVSSFDVMPFPT